MDFSSPNDYRPPIIPSTDDIPLVSIIIAHWININDTIECLESISKVNYPCLRVILVSNGSPDFDEARIRQVLPDVQIIRSQENLGFAGGYNLGINRALSEGINLLFLLNNDTVVSPDIIWSLLPAFNEPNTGIVGPAITYYDKPEKVWEAGGGYCKLIGYSYLIRPLTSFDGNRKVDWISGCALLVRREVFENIGLLWEPFFLNCEEIEFCLRAAKYNYKCVQVGKSLVRHKVSASHGIRGTNNFSPEKAYYYARNHFHLLRLHASGLYAFTGILSQFIIILPFWFLQCILARNVGVLRYYIVGMLDGILGRLGKIPS